MVGMGVGEGPVPLSDRFQCFEACRECWSVTKKRPTAVNTTAETCENTAETVENNAETGETTSPPRPSRPPAPPGWSGEEMDTANLAMQQPQSGKCYVQ